MAGRTEQRQVPHQDLYESRIRTCSPLLKSPIRTCRALPSSPISRDYLDFGEGQGETIRSRERRVYYSER